MPTNLAALVGNGLSIAYTLELTLESITQAVIERMTTWDGPESMAVIRRIAERALPVGAASEQDFETLIGAFGFEEGTLQMLRELALCTSDSDEQLVNAIEAVASYARGVADVGLSFVLEVIAERSRFSQSQPQPIAAFVAAVTERRWDRVVFGNLNYDTLLLAELLRSNGDEVADLGDGRRSIELDFGDAMFFAHPLRRNMNDFPDRRLTLLHLHGSMAYWRESPESQTYGKLSREDVESPAVWSAIREQRTEARPMVVLASQVDKTSHINQYPYNVCYQGFKDALENSQHWLIAGYSFRDEPVNSILRDEFLVRDPKPRVLVVTYGTELGLDSIHGVLGWGREDGSSTSWLSLVRGGVQAMPTSREWQEFADSAEDY